MLSVTLRPQYQIGFYEDIYIYCCTLSNNVEGRVFIFMVKMKV